MRLLPVAAVIVLGISPAFAQVPMPAMPAVGTLSCGSSGAGRALCNGSGLSYVKPALAHRLWNYSEPFTTYPNGTGGLATTPQTTQYTIGQNFSIPGNAVAIRLILENPAMTTATLGGMIAAPSATAVPISVPTGTWTAPITAGAQWDGTDSATPTLPAAASVNQPWIGLSDVVPFQTVARTDGGTMQMIQVRTLTPTGSYSPALELDGTGLGLAAYNAITGENNSIWYQAGNFVTTNVAALTDPAVNQGTAYPYVVGVAYETPDKAGTLLVCGDSLEQGFLTASGMSGAGTYAMAQINANTSFKMSVALSAVTAATTPDIVANCVNRINLMHPQFLLIDIDSPNDYSGIASGAAANVVQTAMTARMTGLIETAMEAGVAQTVVMSPYPFGAYDTAGNYGAQRLAAGNVARAFALNRDVLSVDAQTDVAGFTPTSTLLPTLPAACAASDGAHTNDACQKIVGADVASKLAPRL